MKIVVVEDVVDLRDEIVHWLSREGHEARGAGNSMELDWLLNGSKPQLVILDIGLPGEDGLAICNRLQTVPDLHITMLTARDGEEDRRGAHLAGADSYLVKPVDYSELDAVIRRAAARRRTFVAESTAWELIPGRQLLRAPGGHRIVLTHAETCLLRALMHRSDRTASRAELMHALGLPTVLDDRRIEVSLSRLRSKIKQACGLEPPVKANRAAGYSFLDECRLVD